MGMFTKLSEENIQARSLIFFNVLIHLKLIQDNPSQANILKEKLRKMLNAAIFDVENSVPHYQLKRNHAMDAMGVPVDTSSNIYIGGIPTRAGFIVNPFISTANPPYDNGEVAYPLQYKITDLFHDELEKLGDAPGCWHDLCQKLYVLLFLETEDWASHIDSSSTQKAYDFANAYLGASKRPCVFSNVEAHLRMFTVWSFASDVFPTNLESDLAERKKLRTLAFGRMSAGIVYPPILAIFVAVFVSVAVAETASLEAKDVYSAPEIAAPLAVIAAALVLLSATLLAYGSALKNEANRGSEKYMNGLYAAESKKITDAVADTTAADLKWPEQNAPVSKLLTARNFIARSCGVEEIPASGTGMRQRLE